MSQNYVRSTVHDISRNGQKTANSLPKIAQGSLWERVRSVLPHREDLVMPDGRQIKGGIVLHPIVATAILGAIITIGGAMYHNFSTELSWQHDQLVILATQKDDEQKAAAERKEELEKRLQNMSALQIAQGRDLAKIQEAQKVQDAKGRN